MSLYGNDLRVENRYNHILKKWYVKSNDRFINLICEPYQKLNFIESLISDCLFLWLPSLFLAFVKIIASSKLVA